MQSNWVYLTKLGNCACIGSDGDDRQRVRVGANRLRAWLYEMKDHNIDSPLQALSLLLGIGALANHAATVCGW